MISKAAAILFNFSQYNRFPGAGSTINFELSDNSPHYSFFLRLNPPL
jgi:hypothetical protein